MRRLGLVLRGIAVLVMMEAWVMAVVHQDGAAHFALASFVVWMMAGVVERFG